MGIPSEQTKLSLVFMFEDGIRVTLLQSGVCVLEGRIDSDAALTKYRRMMDNLQLIGLKVSVARISNPVSELL